MRKASRRWLSFGILSCVLVAACAVDTGGYSFTDQTRCSSVFVDTTTDPRNCGGCGRACGEGQLCAAGTCTCVSGLHTCGSSETCVDLQSSGEHCGTCGASCTAEQSCVAGACKCIGAGLSTCGNECRNTANDPMSCGMCGHACAANGVCVSGTCKCTSANPDLCDAVCTDVSTDPAHCGSCNKSCDFGHVDTTCSAGVCATTGCSHGYADCNGDLAKGGAGNGCETYLDGDPKNCGGCGRACGGTKSCSGGQCRGSVVCQGACQDTTDCFDATMYCASTTAGKQCLPTECQACFNQNGTCSVTQNIFDCNYLGCK
jgi:hypothetical protein